VGSPRACQAGRGAGRHRQSGGQYPSLQTGPPAIERGRRRSGGAMADNDQAVDNARVSSRPLPQGFGRPDRVHLYLVTTTFSPAISARSILRRATSACARGSPMSRRSTTEVSSPRATRPSLGNAPTNVAQPMRLSPGVPAKGTHPGPVGSRILQNPHGLLPDEPPLYPDLRPGSEVESYPTQELGGWVALSRLGRRITAGLSPS